MKITNWLKMKLKKQLPAQESGDKENYFEKIKEKKQIPKTPFTIVTTNKGESFITCGQYRITETKKNKKELEDMIRTRSWELITQLITISYEFLNRKEK